MNITNQIKTRTIELEKVSDEEDYGYLSYQFACNIQTAEITTNFNRRIWIGASEIDQFIVKLQQLDETRMGEVELQGIRPKEFTLVIKGIDLLGHLAVNLRLEKEAIYSDTYWDKIEVEFEIDPTSIPYIIQDLKRVRTDNNGR